MKKSLFFFAATLCCAAACGSAQAAVAPSRVPVETVRDREMERVRALLAEDEVRTRLQKLGVSSEEIEARLEKMDDAEISRLADQLDETAAGRGAVGVVIVLLVIASLVLLIIYLAERV